MDAGRTEQLERSLVELQERWGSQAICTLRHAERLAPEGISTGFPALDALTGAKGISVGYITALVGQPSSGATTLAYRLTASAQRQMRVAIWQDTNRIFDPACAQASYVDFKNLLLSRPANWEHALAVTRDVAGQLLNAFIVLSLPLRVAPEDVSLLAGLLRILPAICHRNSNTVILLSSGPDWQHWQAGVMPRAALVLQLARTGWLADSTGITFRVTLTQNRFAPPGQWADLTLIYPELP